ncbi:MAG: zinc ribbon domain-containing protein [Gemmataceae bacterium]|nr:zinc ribbon domain-containing protein [Gemmataceae bacterium]
MPTYEYQCDACDHNFDEFQSMSEPPLKKCPKCGRKKLRRLFGTGAAILFKGAGFYETDYRSDSYKQAVRADQESSAGSSSKSDNKSDAKSDSSGTTGEASATGGKTSAKGAGKSSRSAT